MQRTSAPEASPSATAEAGARDPRARLLACLLQGVRRGTALPPSDVALLVGRHAFDLVEQSQANPHLRELTRDARLQAHLREVVTVLGAAAGRFGALLPAIYWYRTAALPGSSARTPEEAVAAGQAEIVRKRLLAAPANDSAASAHGSPQRAR